MARGLNQCTFIGNLGADPEIRYSPNGKAVANIRIGVSEQWKDRESGERQERTEWVRAVAFNRTAEVVGEYLRKGSKVYIQGKMQTRKWQDKEGQDRYTTEIVINDLMMLDGQGGGGQGGNRPAQSGGGGSSQGGGSPAPNNQPDDDFDDDIPFVTAWSAW